MLLGIVIVWLTVNALIVAFLVLHPLRHFSGAQSEASASPPVAADAPSPRSMV